MKIISKYKDYYDYLVGIYGIDEKLILDRTDFKITKDYSMDTKITFHICGQVIDGLYRGGAFYFTDQLAQFDIEENKKKWYYWNPGGIKDRNYYIKLDQHIRNASNIPFLKLPTKQNPDWLVNDIFNCPILIEDALGDLEHKGHRFSKFPILKDYNMKNVYTPDQIWQMIYDFLSRTKDIPNNQTDKEKIISRGFDFKHSFRNTK